jgi:type II secretory pathway pseudopilin PulG
LKTSPFPNSRASAPRSIASPGDAFSLIEVVLAIGVIAFALVLVIGLLPVGLNSMKHAREEAAAAVCMSQISQALMYPSTTSTSGSTVYTATGVWGSVLPTWSGTGIGAPTSFQTPVNPLYVSLGGVPASTTMDQRLNAHVSIMSPYLSAKTYVKTTGTAYISIAWPATATWNNANPNTDPSSTIPMWKNADGWISSVVVLLPP